MNDTVVKLDPSAPSISNTHFLGKVFGNACGSAHITGFSEDPGDLVKLGRSWLWKGGRAEDLLKDMRSAWNNFFTISTFKPDPVTGGASRKKTLFDRCYCIVLDDVGLRGLGASTSAKVEANKVKLKPSWTLETSPGNWQVGYILDGGDGRGGKVTALLEAMVDAGLVSDGSDPGMKGVTRYVRLPSGRNTKAKYGAGGWNHVLGSWNPGRTYTLEEIADAYDVRDAFDAAPDDLGVGSVGTFDFGTDRLGQALKDAGVVLSEDTVKKLWHVECPFVEEHTQREASGTAYLGEGRWNCHHGHCEGRDHAEFTEAFKAKFPDAWTNGMFGGLEVQGPEAVAPSSLRAEAVDIFGEEAVEQVEGDTGVEVGTGVKVAKRPRFFSFEDAASSGPVVDIEWLFWGLAEPQGLGVIYGAPGTGKTFVALDMGARAACGLSWNGHDYEGAADGVVVYVAGEGGPQTLRNRAVGWVKHNGGKSPSNMIVYPGALSLGRKGDAAQKARFIRWCKGLGVGVVMLVLDTLARNMTGDENATEDMSAMIRDVDEIKDALGCFAWLVHHSGKDRSKGSRGSSALKGAIDVELELERDVGPVSTTPGTIYVNKTREGDAMGRRYGYQLVEVDLGVDSKLRSVGTLAVDSVKAPATGNGKKINRTQQVIIDVHEEEVGAGNWIEISDLASRVRDYVRDEEAEAKAKGEDPGLKPQRPSYYKGKIKDLVDDGLLREKTDEDDKVYVSFGENDDIV